jgi:NADPH-dependent stearoyl-CoA 9-desaturase
LNRTSPCTASRRAEPPETEGEKSAQSRAVVKKIARQMAKDYLGFSALRRSRRRRTMGANVAANVARILWGVFGDFCAHFPDGAEKFTAAAVEEESKPDWYIRQFWVSPTSTSAHCWRERKPVLSDRAPSVPRLRSNRYAQIATRVRRCADKFDLPDITGLPLDQHLQKVRTIHKLALPDRFLTAAS